MKNSRIFLHEWVGDYSDGYVDIPWPLIHQHVDPEIISWINSKDLSEAQMILDRDRDGMQRLYAEFYRPEIRTEFALIFAK
jgi:hypothetical protein